MEELCGGRKMLILACLDTKDEGPSTNLRGTFRSFKAQLCSSLMSFLIILSPNSYMSVEDVVYDAFILLML